MKINPIIFLFCVLFGVASAQKDSLKKSLRLDTTLNLKIETENVIYYSDPTGNARAHKAEILFLSGDNLSKRQMWNGKNYNRKILDGFVKNCPVAMADHEKTVDFFNKEKKARSSMVLSAVAVSVVGAFGSIAAAYAFPDQMEPILIGGLVTVGVLVYLPLKHFAKKISNYHTVGKSYLYSTVNTYNIQCH